jgi:predicted HD phosphohydrolase
MRCSTKGRANGTGGRYEEQRRFSEFSPGERIGRSVPQGDQLECFVVTVDTARSYDENMTTTKTVEFTRMADGTRDEYQYLHGLEQEYISELPERLIQALRRLDDGLEGYKVSRYQHSLQTATRAMRDGADIEMIVAALVHDIGDDLSPENHSQVAASIIRPYVRAEVTWVVNMHGIFQYKYYGHHIDVDPDQRDAYRDHRWYDSCANFCERWDQESFDPDYPTEPIETFEPMLREIFTRHPFDPAIVDADTVQSATNLLT